MSQRIGVFGGTFDPPHFGHLAIAEWAREQLALDLVLFVPAAHPPHKLGRARSPVAARVAMARLAVRDNLAFRVSTLETRRRGPSYTADTLRTLARRHPKASLFLILGQDSLNDLPDWHEPAAIAGLATLVVAPRGGGRAGGRCAGPRSRGSRAPAGRAPGLRAARVVWLSSPALDISSSVLRTRARAGRSLRYLVPEAVLRYAARHRLYRRRT